MKNGNFVILLATLLSASSFAMTYNSFAPDNQAPFLQKKPGFFRLSYDYMNMPNNMEKMGLLGVNYFADITPLVYTGMGMYGSTVGTQGGLFVLTVGGGLHYELLCNLWGDAGFDIGGGGGRSSLVGGGLMLRPHAGLQYDFGPARLGVHYSYIDFPTGDIHSSQVGASLDIPFDFYYLKQSNAYCHTFRLEDLKLPFGKYLRFNRNDFGLLAQAYFQHSGTRNNAGQVQDGTIGLVGAEFDHYISDSVFWWLKGSGAFTGIPNGYMDILGGFGYQWQLGHSGFAIVPQAGIGAGGGGMVDTGGGVLLEPKLGLDIPLSQSFSFRTSGGYLWSPKGELGAYTLTGALLYHLDVATATSRPPCMSPECFNLENWRINIFNQTYINPQRTFTASTAPINLLALQFDQLFNPWFFMAYQGSFAYAGYHAGGYATGMIGPGFQTPEFFCKRMQLFAEVLVGAGGGGSLQLNGGSLIEPVVGVHYYVTDALGLQLSVGELKALQAGLNTPVVNAGITIRFGTVNKSS